MGNDDWHHLRGRTSDLVVDTSGGMPVIVHWGAPLGAVDLASVAGALERPVVFGGPDAVAPLSIVPLHGDGFPGTPGLLGHRRGGTAWAPRFTSSRAVRDAGGRLVITAVDPIAGLELVSEIELDEVLRVRCTLRNAAATRYLLDALTVTLPLPDQVSELLTFDGRWTREFHGAREPFLRGARVIENRRGRTSHEHVPLVFAGTSGFGEWHGEVWGVHLAWSGDHRVHAEVLPDGRRLVQLGELLHPGEIALEPGEAYSTPEVVAVYAADGLTPATWGFHRAVRHTAPRRDRPRPVVLNTWEAVYFDHDLDRLRRLADVAAEVGVERFVLDDGWFGARRDDRRALGDWWVSPEVYPDGLAPLVDHVRGLGMEFGLWLEPEMISPDSDLARAHPDWALVTAGYEPLLARHQLVLDIARPEVFEYLLGRIDELLSTYDIGFVKWDMNRDLVQGSGANGAAGARAHTLAVYRLIDAVRARHPHVEIESCASGGGRIDHEILRRVERVWTSDVNDALERQLVQRGASMLIPPEVMGAHIGPPRSHTTGRHHTLAFRATTAMFGHLGVEWDLLELDDTQRSRLGRVIELHRSWRHLLHGGDTVRFDPVVDGAGDAAPVIVAHGVYATDRSEALVSIAQLRTAASLVAPTVRMPGLDPASVYAIEVLDVDGPVRGAAARQPVWSLPAASAAGHLELTGRQLAVHGVRPPTMAPESALLVHLRATGVRRGPEP